MKDIKMETAVGVFMLIGIACLAWLSIKLGNVDISGGTRMSVEAEFTSVQGLKAGSGVEIAGVEIGTIKSIEIRDYKAVVKMEVRRDIPLQEDAIASIRTRGLIGDKYINISPGGSDRLIEPGGKIRDTEPPLDFEKLIGQFIHGKSE
ncbi:MAG: outer membrane lipid asymmetry maintenance protein MlaD [Syntrophorhabdaceae bacterium]|nr:outer membrane lipid asymmetry maintenance protein MlaD [Syntrophorhabdaceae bacterium]